MNKRRQEAAVLNGRMAELAVQQVNAEPWEPPTFTVSCIIHV
jgi:hypothetical protein